MNWRGVICAAWLLLLEGCGGGQSEAPDPSRFIAAMHAQSMRSAAAAPTAAASTSPMVVDADALFDWAEWKYPALFPKGPKTELTTYRYSSYLVRAYPNGNYLGMLSGTVYGMGPFTKDVALRLGDVRDFEAQVRADVCPVYGIDCRAPSIVTQPLNNHTAAGQPATFSVASTSPQPQSYRWQSSTDGGRSFADIPGAMAASYTLPAAALSEDGRLYRVVVVGRDGSTTSNVVMLSVRPAIATNYFPLQAGSVWFYRRPDGFDPDQVRVVGTQTSEQGELGTVIESIDGSDKQVSHDLFVVGADGIRQFFLDPQDAVTQLLNGLTLLRLPVVPGESVELLDSLVDGGIDVDGDGQPDQVHVVATMSVVGIEAVATPAAQFNQALRQRVTITMTVQLSGANATRELRSIADVWYVDGVGQVKWTLRSIEPGRDATQTFLLEAFQVGSLRSDFTPPHPLETKSLVTFKYLNGDYGVGFDETIDATSVNAGTLAVTDSQGRAVAGSLAVSGPRIEFKKGGEWAEGEYTVRLAPGVRDRFGNATVEGRAWTVRIDGHAPGIVSATPANGATGVPLSTSLTITFSEPPLAAAMTSTSVSFRSGIGYLAVRSELRGNTLILTPATPLQPATDYSIEIRNITDVAGNELPVQYWSFRTEAGRFAEPVALGGRLSNAERLTVADFNGDGLQDVLGQEPPDTGPTVRNHIFIRYGRTDRTLGDPVAVTWDGDADCTRWGFATGDLDGDGRTDIIVPTDKCGTLVLTHVANGVFKVVQTLGYVGSGLQIADLDGNGRPVLLASSGQGQITIWRRNNAGQLALSQTVDSGTDRARYILAADVNGDGRRDLVFYAEPHNQRACIGVMTQRADGSFAPGPQLQVAREGHELFSINRITIADINGDGRVDIIATAGYYGNEAMVAVFLQAPGGTFGSATRLPSADLPQELVAADINRDGRLDLVVSHGGSTVGIYMQRPDGSLAPEERYAAKYSPGFEGGEMAVADIDGDGWPDIVTSGVLIRQVPPVSAAMVSPGVTASRLPRVAGGVLRRQLTSPLRPAVRKAAP